MLRSLSNTLSSRLFLRRGLGLHAKGSVRSLGVNAPESLIDECLQHRAELQPINDRIRGPLDKNSTKNTAMPFVLLLGNHSSGKSSFVNYVCGRKVQTAGVAPTDDNFTVIVPGPADGDRDGPAFIGDPDLGFGGLRSFGPSLIHHTCLKIRSRTSIQDFAIVDSPGMIDSPRVRTHIKGADGQYQLSDVMDRGYDFEGVCKWLAQRADVILLFFDPDKPGTTGETLSILTNSLAGMDHKLHIVLNKADQFHKMSDFARAYGSLCWNLSKVIQRKDLPRIYTMCLPPTSRAKTSESPELALQQQQQDAEGSSGGGSSSSGRTVNVDETRAGDWARLDRDGQGLIDLETTREDVVREVLSAPKRRVLNEISRLQDDAHLLQLHYSVVNELASRYSNAVWRHRATTAAVLVGATGSAGGAAYLSLPVEVVFGTGAVGLMGAAFAHWFGSKSVEDVARRMTSPEGLDEAYQRTASPRDRDPVDEYNKDMWRRAKDQMLTTFGGADVDSVCSDTTRSQRASDLKSLTTLLDVTIPDLRRAASPKLDDK